LIDIYIFMVKGECTNAYAKVIIHATQYVDWNECIIPSIIMNSNIKIKRSIIVVVINVMYVVNDTC
jgi:hypothetical protein